MYRIIQKIISGSIITAIIICTFFAKNANAEERISSNTVISKDNIREVCDYLGLDDAEIISEDTTISDITTVGELETIISEVKTSMSSTINHKTSTEINDNRKERTSRASSAKTLSRSFDNDGYIFKVSVAVKYSNKKFVSVGSPKVSVSGPAGPVVYKYYNDTLKSSCTSSKVTVSGNVKVNSYVGVANVGLVKIGTQTSTIRCNWYASSSL